MKKFKKRATLLSYDSRFEGDSELNHNLNENLGNKNIVEPFLDEKPPGFSSNQLEIFKKYIVKNPSKGLLIELNKCIKRHLYRYMMLDDQFIDYVVWSIYL